MKKIHEVAKDVKNKLKSNIQYLLARDARQKLKSFTIWIMVISIIGFVVLGTIVGLVAWIIVTRQWGQGPDSPIYPVYGGILALVIIDLVLLIGWFALMILIVVVSRKAGEPLNGKGMNILYLSLLVAFVAMGIVVIVLFLVWVLGYLNPDTQRTPVIVSIAVLEGLRAGILLTVFVTACRYRYILRKFFNKPKEPKITA